jgi:cellulose synthase/poly-beta-1,6-N-acetylglucosamine synthase-like glycosyltransferase
MIEAFLIVFYSAGFSFMALYGMRMLGLTLGWWWVSGRKGAGGSVTTPDLGGLPLFDDHVRADADADNHTHAHAHPPADAEGQDQSPPSASKDLPRFLPKDLPIVTVQLPLYNEATVASRAIDALCRLRWPKDRLEIQVLDDSTDETCALVDASAEAWRRRGVDIRVIRRLDRTGFKAGALAAGTQVARGDVLAIFDADFVPQPDFLLNMVPHLGPGVAAVQARWGHLNPNDSLLTRAQALALDGHFLIEQVAQSRLGLFLNFNGTAGIWRRAAIEEAGGWQGDTLTEDFDLSYRAQLAGWRIEMRPEVVAPAELPDSLLAFKRQQRRWAAGTVQVLGKLGAQILRAPIPIHKRLLAILTLSGYFVQPVMLALLLAAPLLVLNPVQFPAWLGLLSLAPFGPPILSAFALSPPSQEMRRLVDYPALGLLTIGMSASGTRAILDALRGRAGGFERTPKRGDAVARANPAAGMATTRSVPLGPRDSASSAYHLAPTRPSTIEACLAAYAWIATIGAFQRGPLWMASFLGLFALGHSLVAWLTWVGPGSRWHGRWRRLLGEEV